MSDYTEGMQRRCARWAVLGLWLGATGLTAATATGQPAFPRAELLDQTPHVEFGDAEMRQLAHLFEGQWRTAAGADSQARPWTLRAVRVPGKLLTQPVYLELVRKDEEASPLRQWILAFYRSNGDLRARVYEFPMGSGLKGLCVGLWAAPEHFPVVTPSQLDVIGDFAVEQRDGAYVFTSTSPFLLNHHTQWSMDASLEVTPLAIRWTEKVYDKNGQPLPASAVDLTLTREGELPRAEERALGVQVIDLREGRGGKADDGDVLVFWYSGWLENGTLFETNHTPGSSPLQLALPNDRIIEGWSIGLQGIRCTETYETGGGGIRKLIIPPAAAMGASGGMGKLAAIPPNATVIFTIEMVAMKDNTPEAPDLVEDPFKEMGAEKPDELQMKQQKGEKKPPSSSGGSGGGG